MRDKRPLSGAEATSTAPAPRVEARPGHSPSSGTRPGWRPPSTDGPQYLIGPGLYWDYRRALRALLMIVPPAVALTVSTVQAFTGTPPLAVLLDGAVAAARGRLPGRALDHAGLRHRRAHRCPTRSPGRRPWSVADLPRTAAPRGHARRDGSARCWACWSASPRSSGSRSAPGSRDAGAGRAPAGSGPTGRSGFPALIALMSAGRGTAAAGLRQADAGRPPAGRPAGRRGRALRRGVGITMLLTQQVLNPAFFAELGHLEWAAPGSPLTQGLAWLIGVGVVVDIVDIVRKART